MRHLRLTRPEGTGQRWEISGLDDSFRNRLRGATEASLVGSIPIHPRQICHGSQVPLTVSKPFVAQPSRASTFAEVANRPSDHKASISIAKLDAMRRDREVLGIMPRTTVQRACRLAT